MDFDYIKKLQQEKHDLTEVSKYDAVVTYYRSLGLDPYKLRGKMGSLIRARIKNSPGFKAWLKLHHYESYNGIDEATADSPGKEDLGAKGSKEDKDGKSDVSANTATNVDTQSLGKGNNTITFYGYPDANTSGEANRPDETEINFTSPVSTNM